MWLFAVFAIVSVSSLPTDEAFSALNDEIDGDVVLPSAANFDTLNEMWHLAYDSIPSAAIIYTNNEEDIVKVIKFLNNYVNVDGTEFRIRASGSSFGGFSKCRQCVVLDIRRMRDIHYIHHSNKVYGSVAAGTQMQNIMDSFETNTFMIPHTRCKNVSASGYYASGGFHRQFAKYGYATDSIIGLRMVLNDGRIILIYDKELDDEEFKHKLINDEQISPDIIKKQSNDKKDLLWAVKGSGAGSFGVITKWYIKTIPLPQRGQILSFELNFAYELDTAPDVLRAFKYMRQITDEYWYIECNIIIIGDVSEFAYFPNGFKIIIDGNYMSGDNDLSSIDYQSIFDEIINFSPNTASSYRANASLFETDISYTQFNDGNSFVQQRATVYPNNRLIFDDADLDALFISTVQWHYNSFVNNVANTVCGPNTFTKCLFGAIILIDFWDDFMFDHDPNGINTAAPNRNAIGMFTVSVGVVDQRLWDQFAAASKAINKHAFDTIFGPLLGTQSYVGYRSEPQADVTNYYGKDLGLNNEKLFEKLQKIKQRYDSQDFFHIDSVSIPVPDKGNENVNFVYLFDEAQQSETVFLQLYTKWALIMFVFMIIVILSINSIGYCFTPKTKAKANVFVN